MRNITANCYLSPAFTSAKKLRPSSIQREVPAAEPSFPVNTAAIFGVYTIAAHLTQAGNLVMENERVTRRALVRVFFLLTANTPLAFGPIERKLLAQFLRGDITLDHVLWLVEERIQNAQAIDQLRQLTTNAVYLQA